MGRRWLWALLLLVLLSMSAAFLSALPSAPADASGTADLGLLLIEEAGGVSVLAVQHRSSAQRAGIRPGDVLLQAGGKPFSTVEELEQLVRACTAPALQLELSRAQVQLTVHMRLPKIH